MKGIWVAITLMNWTLASSGRLEMYTIASATCCTFMVGSTITSPCACGTPVCIRCVIGVSALPTSTWLQAMLYFRPSSDVARVIPVTACFVAVYGIEFGLGTYADSEPLLMIRPPIGSWFFMIWKACCVQRNVPVRLALTTVIHWSYVRSSSSNGGAPVPALLNSTSSRPKASLVWANRFLTDSGSPTSVETTIVLDPSSPASATVCSRGPTRRPANATE